MKKELSKTVRLAQLFAYKVMLKESTSKIHDRRLRNNAMFESRMTPLCLWIRKLYMWEGRDTTNIIHHRKQQFSPYISIKSGTDFQHTAQMHRVRLILLENHYFCITHKTGMKNTQLFTFTNIIPETELIPLLVFSVNWKIFILSLKCIYLILYICHQLSVCQQKIPL